MEFIFSLPNGGDEDFSPDRDVKALLSPQNFKRITYAWNRITYTIIIPVLLLAIASGLAMYKPSQLH